MSRIATLGLGFAVAAAGLACDERGDDVLSVEATGAVAGLVWLDRDGDNELDPSDSPVEDVRVELVPWAGGQAAYSAEASNAGEFLIEDVMVGDYRLRVDTVTLGDSLRIVRLDSANVTVEAGQLSTARVGLSYPTLTIDSARDQPPETRIFVEGLVLTRWGTYGEASLHLRDSTGAIQAVRVAATGAAPGDSVRLLGVVSVQTGQPVLKDASLFTLKTGLESPAPDTLTTAQAADAAGGAADADLIYLDSAVVRDSTRNSQGELVLTVDDGSGPVDVVLDQDVQFFLQFPDGIIGTILQVTGVLFPSSPGGAWHVKPRSSSDVVVGPLSYPAASVENARQEPADTRLIVEGSALNGWATFADSTIHLRDGTGAIRAVQVPPVAIAAGDSVRIVGNIATFLGQPVLTEVSARLIAAGTASPDAIPVATKAAANADNGALDAGLVMIAGAEIQDTARTADGELFLRADDGTGPVDVVLDSDTPISIFFGGSIIGSVVDVTGVLVPQVAGGPWILKPRGSADVVVR